MPTGKKDQTSLAEEVISLVVAGAQNQGLQSIPCYGTRIPTVPSVPTEGLPKVPGVGGASGETTGRPQRPGPETRPQQGSRLGRLKNWVFGEGGVRWDSSRIYPVLRAASGKRMSDSVSPLVAGPCWRSRKINRRARCEKLRSATARSRNSRVAQWVRSKTLLM